MLLLWSIPLALLKVYDVAARFQRSKGLNWPEIPTWGYEALLFLALLVAPIVAYVRQTWKQEGIQEELARLRYERKQALITFANELQFGQESVLPIGQQIAHLTSRLDDLETRAKANDFSRAADVIPVTQTLLRLYKKYFGSAGHAFGEIYERVRILVDVYVSNGYGEPCDRFPAIPPDINPLTGRLWREPVAQDDYPDDV